MLLGRFTYGDGEMHYEVFSYIIKRYNYVYGYEACFSYIIKCYNYVFEYEARRTS